MEKEIEEAGGNDDKKDDEDEGPAEAAATGPPASSPAIETLVPAEVFRLGNSVDVIFGYLD